MTNRLTDEQVAELRARFAGGARQVDLAQEYGISQNTVSSLVRGRTRKNAGGPVLRDAGRKLTDEQVLSIRNALADGTPAAALAARLT